MLFLGCLVTGCPEFGFFLAHEFPFQSDFVGVVNQPVEDGIRQRGMAEILVPVLYGGLKAMA
jgi:hypothetical protein